MSLTPRSLAGVTALQVAALVLPTLVALWHDGSSAFPILATSIVTALFWETVFAGGRKRRLSAHGVTTGALFMLFCPPDVALWQIAFATTLGAVFGELIFGGRGFGFVSPAALALSVLLVAFPDVSLRAQTPEVVLAMLPGLALLLATRLVSPLVILGCLVPVLLLAGQGPDVLPVALVLLPGLIFLVADPSVACGRAIGRWVYGMISGALVVVFSPASGMTPEAVVAAALLASVFGPLIDHVVSRVDLRGTEGRDHV